VNKLVKYNIFIIFGALLLTLEKASLNVMIYIPGRAIGGTGRGAANGEGRMSSPFEPQGRPSRRIGDHSR
jgi:hypothetical protein